MEVMCSRGCGYPVTIFREAVDEMIDLGRPVSVSHEVCPNEPDAPQHDYKMIVQVFRDGEMVVQVGDTVVAGVWDQAVVPLGEGLQAQWKRVVGMGSVIDASPTCDKEGCSDPVQGLGLCAKHLTQEMDKEPRCKLAGCGFPLHDDLVEIGYCTSAHEREDNDNG